MKKMFLVFAVLLSLLLTGCGGVGKYGDYNRGVNSSNQQTTQVYLTYLEESAETDREVVKAFAAAGNTAALALYAANSNLNKQMAMGNFKMIVAQKPTQWEDVFMTVAAKTFPSVFKTTALYFGAKDMFDAFGALGAGGDVILSGAGSSYNSKSGNAGSFNSLSNGDGEFGFDSSLSDESLTNFGSPEDELEIGSDGGSTIVDPEAPEDYMLN